MSNSSEKPTFDRLPEPYRSDAIADRNSSELSGIPCTEEEAVLATERYLAENGPERVATATKRGEQAARDGKDFLQAFKEAYLETLPPKE